MKRLITHNEIPTILSKNNTKTLKDNRFTLAQLTKFVFFIHETEITTTIPTNILNTLDKGLDFVPRQTRYPKETLQSDFQDFHRRLRWEAYHSDDPKELNEQRYLPSKLLKNKISSNEPPTCRHATFFTKNLFKDFVLTLKSLESPTNTPSTEEAAAKEVAHFFHKHKNLIVKPADKGSAIVIMTSNFYYQMGLRYLTENTNFFVKLDKDPITETTQHILSNLKILLNNHSLNDYIFKILTPGTNVRTPYLYFLPKIHKTPNIPGRPIVSGNGHPAEAISTFIDFLLQPFSTKHPLYLQDTTSLLEELNGLYNIPNTALLFSIDVVNMYTNIPLTEMINEIILETEANPQKLRYKKFHITSKTLRTLLELVLLNNTFMFANTYYLQTHGVAMGTPCACTVSDIFICRLAAKHFFSWRQKPTIYKQYRDDSFGIWLHGEKELKNFVDYLNTIHPTIKFTYTFGKEIQYLDLVIRLTPFGTIETETFYKPTDTFQYLHFTSNHPAHCIRNIPKSQAIRHLRNCSRNYTYRSHLHLLSHNLLERGFPHRVVRRQLNTIKNIKRINYLSYKTKQRNRRTPLVLFYNKGMPSIQKTMHRTWKPHFFFEPPLVAFRTQQTLGQRIIRAKYATKY
jgi:hypothetical protein